AATDYQRLVALHQKKVDDLKAYETQLPAKLAEWEKKFGRATEWTALEPENLKSSGGATLTKQKDNSILVSGEKNATPDIYTLTATTKLKGVTAVRLEALTDPALPAKGPGRAPNGNFVLNEFKVQFAKTGDKGKPKAVKLTGA